MAEIQAKGTTIRIGYGGYGSTDWRDHAACRDIDPELFFPVGNAGPALVQVSQAKQVCAACPVRVRCLEWALSTGQESGVWGGTSEDERRVLRRARQAGARPDAAGSSERVVLAAPGPPSPSPEVHR